MALELYAGTGSNTFVETEEQKGCLALLAAQADPTACLRA